MRAEHETHDGLASVPLHAPEPGELLVAWRRAPFPVDWDRAFGRTGPLHLEVGFGDGRFTARRARDEPDGRFVGLEVSNVSVQRSLARLRRDGVENVRLLKLGAEFASRHLFARAALASVTVNFPDPWPKERHREHRLLRPAYFATLAARLERGGEVRLATDHLDYLAFACESATADGRYTLLDVEPPPAVFETKYATKWKGQGKPLYYQVFRLDRPADSALTPLERHPTMPHAFLTGTLPTTPAPRLEKLVVPYGDGHVIVHEALRAVDDAERWVFRATVDEPDLVQQVLVVAQRREGGELIVRLERFGDPLVTPTARGAVHAVTTWLADVVGLQVGARNY
ncbi:tRNA (guanosine(46)-N7)-methyltransferase TrmB [soil metagenome]